MTDKYVRAFDPWPSIAEISEQDISCFDGHRQSEHLSCLLLYDTDAATLPVDAIKEKIGYV